ncbi:MAG: exodeoxyribonuclease VII small subunit [Clostridia bacterium]|nr:exodeoxyribonuclease VII small subunit [Clostridia bacterium]
MAERKINLEEAMTRLEEIVTQLENEKLPLETSLKLYEEGVKLASKCASELEAAKRKIQILQQGKDGGIEIVDVPEGTFSEQ